MTQAPSVHAIPTDDDEALAGTETSKAAPAETDEDPKAAEAKAVAGEESALDDAGAADGPTDAETDGQDAPIDVQDVHLGEAAEAPAVKGGGQIDILLDTMVEVTAVLGSASMPVARLLDLGPGAVLQLDRRTGEPVDLRLNGLPFARGTLVVVGNQIGIRVREVLKPSPGPASHVAEA